MFKLVITVYITLHGAPVSVDHVMDSGLTLDDCVTAMMNDDYTRPWISAIACEKEQIMRVYFRKLGTNEVSTQAWVGCDEPNSEFGRDIRDICQSAVELADDLTYVITDDQGNPILDEAFEQ